MADKTLALTILARDKASATLNNVGGAAEKTGGKFGGLSKVAGVLGAFGGAALIGFGKNAISAASDVNESLSKAQTVFGASSKSVEAFASTAATKLGQTRGDVLEAAGTFGNLFTALGITQKAAAGMSTSAVTLAADLGSFNNASAPEALDAIKSGLLGEAEPLKKFGVNLSAARIQAEAFALGLAKPTKNAAAITAANNKVTVAVDNLAQAQKKHGKTSTEAKLANDALAKAQDVLSKATAGSVGPLTAAQKAQAAYSIIQKDTKTAQGDFARTSGGLANQQKILSARFGDLTAQIGAKLLPLVVKGAQKFNELASFIEKNKAVIGPVAAAIGILGGGLFLVVKVTKAYTAVQAALNVVMEANPVGLAVIAFALLAVGFTILWKKSETFRDVVKGVFDVVKIAALGFALVAVNAFTMVLRIWMETAGGILHGAAIAFGWLPGIGKELKGADTAFRGMKDAVIGTMTKLSSGIRAEMKKTVRDTAIQSALTGVAMKTGLANRLPEYMAIARKFGMTLPEVISRAGLPTKDKAKLMGMAAAQGLLAAAPTMGSVSKRIAAMPSAAMKDSDTRASAIAYATGKNIADGVAAGIAANKQRMLIMAGSMGAAAANAVRHGAQVFSPSKITLFVGKMLGQGLVDGMTGTLTKVNATSRQLAAAVTKTFVGEERNSLLSIIRQDTSALDILATRRIAVAGRLAVAQQKLKDITTTRIDYARSVADGARSFNNVTSVQASDPNGGAVTATDILGQMSGRLAKLRAFAANIARLRKRGLSSTVIDQLAQQNVEGGGAYAAALVSGGTGLVRQVNSLSNATSSSANTLGKSAAGSMYDVGVKSAAGLIKGLQSQEAAIAATMTRIAKSMVAAIKHALGIRSPSRVLAEQVGHPIGAGLIAGMHSYKGKVGMAADELARAAIPDVPSGLPTRNMRGSVAGGGDTYNITVQGAVDPMGTARQIEMMLARLKRERGTKLAFA